MRHASARRITVMLGIGIIVLLALTTVFAALSLYRAGLEDWKNDLKGDSSLVAENMAQTLAGCLVLEGFP